MSATLDAISEAVKARIASFHPLGTPFAMKEALGTQLKRHGVWGEMSTTNHY